MYNRSATPPTTSAAALEHKSPQTEIPEERQKRYDLYAQRRMAIKKESDALRAADELRAATAVSAASPLLAGNQAAMAHPLNLHHPAMSPITSTAVTQQSRLLDREAYEKYLKESLSPLMLHDDEIRFRDECEVDSQSIYANRERDNRFFSPAEIQHNLAIFKSRMRSIYVISCSQGENAVLRWKADLHHLNDQATSWNYNLKHRNVKQMVTSLIAFCHTILTKPLTDLVGYEFQQWLDCHPNSKPNYWRYDNRASYLFGDFVDHYEGSEFEEWVSILRHYHDGRSRASDLTALKIAYARQYLSDLMTSKATEIVSNKFFNPCNREGKLLRDIMLDLCSDPDSAYDRFIKIVTAAFSDKAGLTQENLRLYTSVAGIEATKAFLAQLEVNLSKLSLVEIRECINCVPLLLSDELKTMELLQAQETRLLQTKTTTLAKGKTASSMCNKVKQLSVKHNPIPQHNVTEPLSLALFNKANTLLSEGKNEQAYKIYNMVIDALRGQRIGSPFEKPLTEASSDDAVIETLTLVSMGIAAYVDYNGSNSDFRLYNSTSFDDAKPFLHFLNFDRENTISNSELLTIAGNMLFEIYSNSQFFHSPSLAIAYFKQALKLDSNNNDAKKALIQLANKYNDAGDALLELERENKTTSASAAIATPSALPSQPFTPTAALAAMPKSAPTSTTVPPAVKPVPVTSQRLASTIAAAIAIPPDAPSLAAISHHATVTSQQRSPLTWQEWKMTEDEAAMSSTLTAAAHQASALKPAAVKPAATMPVALPASLSVAANKPAAIHNLDISEERRFLLTYFDAVACSANDKEQLPSAASAALAAAYEELKKHLNSVPDEQSEELYLRCVKIMHDLEEFIGTPVFHDKLQEAKRCVENASAFCDNAKQSPEEALINLVSAAVPAVATATQAKPVASPAAIKSASPVNQPPAADSANPNPVTPQRSPKPVNAKVAAALQAIPTPVVANAELAKPAAAKPLAPPAAKPIPNTVYGWISQGEAHMDSKEFDKAVECFTNALLTNNASAQDKTQKKQAREIQSNQTKHIESRLRVAKAGVLQAETARELHGGHARLFGAAVVTPTSSSTRSPRPSQGQGE